MKLQGGYLPRVPGQPAATVREIAVPARLEFPLDGRGLRYTPAVNHGERVAFGAPLAWAETGGGRVALPAPASGRAFITPAGKQSPPVISLDVEDPTPRAVAPALAPDKADPKAVRQALAAGGVWHLLYSSKTGGVPALDGSEAPARIIVSFIATEPFRASGETVIGAARDRIAAGLRFLPRLLADSGTIHLVAAGGAKLAEELLTLAAGNPRIRVEQMTNRYPAEHPRVLCRALRRQEGGALGPRDTIWVLNAQAAQAVGDCLASGLPLHERLMALGGPGFTNPHHVRARIGTPVSRLLPPEPFAGDTLLLRGGLFRGEPADAAADAVDASDDAFFAMPRSAEREFMGFVALGNDRVSILPCFLSALTGAKDRHLSATLRGEVRPCIACGLCEDLCPMGLMPQVIHRFLYRDALDEAAEAGIHLCIGCGLCSYACPSKIELRHQFAEAQERLRLEREQLAAQADAPAHSPTQSNEALRK